MTETSTKTADTNLIPYSPQNALTIYSPELIRGAKLMGYKPETLLRGMNRCMPIMHQRLYLMAGAPLRHRPVTFARILDQLLEGHELKEQDFRKPEGHQFAKVEEYLPDIELTLGLMLRVKNDYAELQLGAKTAAKLVSAFGADYDTFVASIVGNEEEVAELLGYRSLSNVSDAKLYRHAFGYWANTIYPYAIERHIPHFLQFSDFFEEVGSLRAAWRDDEDPDGEQEFARYKEASEEE